MVKLYDRRLLLNRAEFSALRTVLGDWYGHDRCDLEIGERSVPVQKVGDVAADILKSAVGPEQSASMLLAEKFDSVMGQPLCRFTKFNSLKNRIAYVEVSHPAWLRELSGALKPKIIEKINAELGGGLCDDVKFIPSGRG